MIGYGYGTVVRCEARRGAVQELLVRMDDGTPSKAILYTDTHPAAVPGDRLLLNVTAEKLGLGSGGYHYVVHVMGKERYAAEVDSKAGRMVDDNIGDGCADNSTAVSGHIMKLRYTPLQRSVLAVEEPASPHHAAFVQEQSLDGLPVLIGELHSMLPVVAAWLHERMGGQADQAEKAEQADQTDQVEKAAAPDFTGKRPRVVYIMSDGGALPLAHSVHARTLRQCGWISAAVTYGHAYGGDSEAVNKYTALLAAKYAHGADIAIAVMGPGIVGTGTALGHSGMELSELVHAVHLLGGQPIVVPRISFADRRGRHYGMSHHQLTQLARYTLTSAHVPVPSAQLAAEQRQWLDRQIEEHQLRQKHNVLGIETVSVTDITRCLERYPHEVRTMGRSVADDPVFFVSAACAAEFAFHLYRSNSDRRAHNE